MVYDFESRLSASDVSPIERVGRLVEQDVRRPCRTQRESDEPLYQVSSHLQSTNILVIVETVVESKPYDLEYIPRCRRLDALRSRCHTGCKLSSERLIPIHALRC